MTIRHGLGTYGNGVGVVSPLDHKLAQAGLICKNSDGSIRAGVFYAGNASLVSGKANMSYDVAGFPVALSRGATAGAVLLANDGVVNVATTPAPGSNSRIDIIYVWNREFTLDGVDSEPVIGVVQGTAAAIPTAPSLAAYPGAIEIGRCVVPAGVTATNSGTTLTQTAPFTAAAGGVVPFRTKAEMELWLTATKGQPAHVLADGSGYVSNGAGSWAPASGAICVLRKSTNQNLTTSPAALIWDVEVSDPAGMHSDTVNTTRIIAPMAGIYEVSASVYNNNTSGMGTLQARLNGTTDIPGSLDRRVAEATASLPLRHVFPVVMAAGDYVEIMVNHASAAGNIAGGVANGSATVTVKRIGSV